MNKIKCILCDKYPTDGIGNPNLPLCQQYLCISGLNDEMLSDEYKNNQPERLSEKTSKEDAIV